MGTTALFTMSNLHPEMADHIHSAHLLAPGNALGKWGEVAAGVCVRSV